MKIMDPDYFTPKQFFFSRMAEGSLLVFVFASNFVSTWVILQATACVCVRACARACVCVASNAYYSTEETQDLK